MKTMFGISKLPQATKLKRKATKYSRKKFKNVVRSMIKRMNVGIKNTANKGEFTYRFKISDQSVVFEEAHVAYRWYRRFSGLNISYFKEEEEEYQHKNGNKRKILTDVSMNVTW